MPLPTLDQRFDICEGHYVAALEWGHYAMITRLGRYYRPSPVAALTHESLIIGGDETREAHRVYHITSARYHRNAATFDPYSDRMPD
jgi:hypothetical protein